MSETFAVVGNPRPVALGLLSEQPSDDGTRKAPTRIDLRVFTLLNRRDSLAASGGGSRIDALG